MNFAVRRSIFDVAELTRFLQDDGMEYGTKMGYKITQFPVRML